MRQRDREETEQAKVACNWSIHIVSLLPSSLTISGTHPRTPIRWCRHLHRDQVRLSPFLVNTTGEQIAASPPSVTAFWTLPTSIATGLRTFRVGYSTSMRSSVFQHLNNHIVTPPSTSSPPIHVPRALLHRRLTQKGPIHPVFFDYTVPGHPGFQLRAHHQALLIARGLMPFPSI